jgi:hypothetical protein
MRNCIKKVIICSFFTLLFLCVLSQELTFKMDNPRIIRMNNKQWFQYNVYVKASDTGTYLYSSQLAFNVAAPANFINSPSSNIFVDISQGILNGNYYGTPSYTTITSWGNPTTSFGVAIIANIALNGVDPSDACAKITTSFQKIVTIGTEISNPTGISGTAGITFSPQNMPAGPGQVQNYAVAGIPLPTYYPYTDPNLFEGYDFNSIFLSRIFSNIWGWSQYGGTVNNVQYINWSDIVNTSVWDSVGMITTNGSFANKLRVHNGGRLKIMPGYSLTCMDSVDINEPNGLWLGSEFYGTGSFLDAGIITYHNNGSVGVERYLKQNQWHGYCIPVDTTTTRPFLLLQLAMKWYDEPNHVYRSVVNPGMDSLLNREMLGYLVYSNSALTGNSTIKVTGSLNTGPIGFPMGNHIGSSGPDGWNLIGNPYPSAINWLSSSFSLNMVDPTIYVFHPEAGNYFFWNRHDQLHSTGASAIIAAQQGFYMHANIAGSQSGSVFLDNSIRLNSTQPFYKSDTLMNEHLILTVRGNNFTDETRIRFDSATSVLFDSDHDAYKLDGIGEAPQLYSVLPDSTRVALNARPWGGYYTLIPLGFHIGVVTTDTMVASNLDSFLPGIGIWLEDKKTSIWVNLTQTPEYIFNSLPNDNPDRFLLHFSNPYTGLTVNAGGFVRIYSFNSSVYVMNKLVEPASGDIYIYDITGRLIFRDRLKNIGMNKFEPGINQGYFMVRVVAEDNAYIQKVYLK